MTLASTSLADLAPYNISEDKKYYVCYNEWNGEIKYVTSKPVNSRTDIFLETTDIVARKILKGDVNEKEYIVSFINDEDLGIIQRDDKLRLRSSEKTLHQISRNINVDWDIRAKVYLKNNKMLLEINPISIQKLTRLTFKKELHISDESDLTIYLSKHNDPDFYIEKLDVNPVELLDKGNMCFDLSSIAQYMQVQDLGLLTRRCFKNYHVEFINDKLNILQNTLVKNRNFIIDKSYRNIPSSHISVYNKKDHILFKSNVSMTELEDVGILEPKLNIYVCGQHVDEYHGVMEVNTDILKKELELAVPIEIDSLKWLNLLHKKHRLILSIEEE
tara:strand:+ start:30715 stop:31707 length:993 start_codon:yes stop_codon:yes gene_type:complete